MNKNDLSRTAASLCLGLFFSAAGAPGMVASVAAESSAASVELEGFKPTRDRRVQTPGYPEEEQGSGKEGWVYVDFMVDPKGKPYEIVVAHSLGNASFEKSAIAAVEKSTFRPATLGGTPVHSRHFLHFPIYKRTRAQTASSRFEKAYRELAKAIDAGDKTAADEGVTQLKPETLREYALEGLVLYGYHLKWGTESAQREDLRRALAFDMVNTLDKRTLLSAIQELIKIELKLNDLDSALALWRVVRAIGSAEDVKALQPLMEKAEVLSKSGQPVPLSAEIRNGTSWIHLLPRRHFELAVHSGKVSGFKLRCQTEFGVYPYQTGMRYMTGENAGVCRIEVIGEEGTRFDLIS